MGLTFHKRFSTLIPLGVLFFALMAVGVLTLQKQRALDDVLLEDAVWATFQLDRELKSLRISLLRATPETVAEVKLNYDILYSRINVLQRGQVADLVQSVEVRDYNVDSLLERIKALDGRISTLSASNLNERREPLLATLQRIQVGTGDLLLATNRHFARERQKSREGQIRMIQTVLVLAALAMLAGLMLVRQLRRQRASLEASNRELETARAEAEQASQAKTEFLAVISHEVRTPLNGIFGLTDIIQQELTPQSRAYRYLQTLRASADAVFTVVNDILDYSRIRAGKLSLVHRPFCLDEFLETLCRGYRIQAQHGPITFHCHYPDDLGDVRGDPDRLRQVLMNLIDNAFKFTEQGHVALSVEAEQIKDRLDLRFHVADTGCGIGLEDQATLFQAFSQVDTSLTRTHQGSGLGLVISRELIDEMGGDIHIDSEPGRGSRFEVHLRLPIAASSTADAMASDSAEAPTVPTRIGRILVVEDNPVNQLVARAMLSKMGHRVVVVENGRQALEQFEAETFDLVVMDMQMPVMDGLEATRELRARGAALPIIAMTANAMDEDEQRCLDAGMQNVVKKPVDATELGATIERYIPLTPSSDY
ncbi:response regulator [Spiribacter vilamensis]|uniref:histidine kinase n=1 Tax=Spiribacter vilamensis TaxID=531306 RepID=A0A4Q8CZ28_9GAMM|nr:response regulator [Spiribacter vilamensis]RZU98266.1 signal transduction histidine kinase [Spiribacter vilamensis]TVO60839.1 response regulator [Spiribacter vilamensis]